MTSVVIGNCGFTPQVGCFPFFMEFALRNPYPFEACAAWKPAMDAENEAAYRRVLSDPVLRAQLKAEAKSRTIPNRFNYFA